MSERNGNWSEAGRKSSERERSGERAKMAAQNLLQVLN